MPNDDYYSIGMDYLAEEEKNEQIHEEEQKDYDEYLMIQEDLWITSRYKSGFSKFVFYVLEDTYYYLSYKLTEFYYTCFYKFKAYRNCVYGKSPYA